jgi:hypothetical protein
VGDPDRYNLGEKKNENGTRKRGQMKKGKRKNKGKVHVQKGQINSKGENWKKYR